MESWRLAWRNGVAPALSLGGLQALRDAVLSDDPALIQGATTTPPPLLCVMDWPVEAACALAYAAWRGEGKETVGEVEERFARYCFQADQNLNESAGHRWWMNAYDEWPREEMLRNLLPELERELAIRAGTTPPPDTWEDSLGQPGGLAAGDEA